MRTFEEFYEMWVAQTKPSKTTGRMLRTALKYVATAAGVVLAIAGRRAMEVINVPATQAKKIITGNGRAGKQQIQRAIAATLRLERLPEPDDVADALAIALAGLRMRAAVEQVACAAAGARS